MLLGDPIGELALGEQPAEPAAGGVPFFQTWYWRYDHDTPPFWRWLSPQVQPPPTPPPVVIIRNQVSLIGTETPLNLKGEIK